MPYAAYADRSVVLWPADQTTNMEQLTQDTPSTGFILDYAGLASSHENYHGTILVWVEDGQFAVCEEGWLVCDGDYDPDLGGWTEIPTHPDLTALWEVLLAEILRRGQIACVHTNPVINPTYVTDPDLLDWIYDTSDRFLRSRGWVEMEQVDMPAAEYDPNYTGDADTVYWRPVS